MQRDASLGIRRILAAVAVVAALSVLGLAAYGPALDNPLLFDDTFLLAGNDTFSRDRLPDLVTRSYFDFFPGAPVSYRPLSTLSYIVHRQLWGEDYALWRLSYLAWHVANASLLYLLFATLFRSVFLSFLGASLFLVHPVHAELINHVSYNEDIMMTSFLLLAWLFFLAAREEGRPGAGAASVFAFLLATLTKETALFFPLVPVCWVACSPPGDSGNPGRRGGGVLAALFSVSLVMGVVHFGLMKNPSEARSLEYTAAAFLDGLPDTLRIFSSYLRRFLWPDNLAATYSFQGSSWSDPAVVAGAALVLAGGVLLGLGLLRRRRTLAVPAAWYLVGLAPLGYGLFFPHGSYGYDHYLYFPSIGLIWYLVAALAAAWPQRRRGEARIPLLPWILLLACLPLLLLGTRRRSEVWSSDLALWQETAGRSPASAAARYNLGLALQREGRTGEAVGEYRAATEIEPAFSPAWHNLGRIALEEGDYRGAEEYFLRSLESDRHSAGALHGLAVLRRRAGDDVRAEALYRRALEIRPGDRRIVLDLADLYFHIGRDGPAEELYRQILAADGGFAPGWNRLGLIALRQERREEAAGHFRRALEADPKALEAARNLESLLGAGGKDE